MTQQQREFTKWRLAVNFQNELEHPERSLLKHYTGGKYVVLWF